MFRLAGSALLVDIHYGFYFAGGMGLGFWWGFGEGSIALEGALGRIDGGMVWGITFWAFSHRLEIPR